MLVRATHNGRSTEAEIRDIIVAAVPSPERVKLGSLLPANGRDTGLSNSEVDALQTSSDKTAAEPMAVNMISLDTDVVPDSSLARQ
ncbi:FitA-like ribbon-helix-helix domain-containing protein [Shinella sumterensis]|uniref:FitA-like ribbon-helix-helix domain-containing protein n=1 Tax=Shinella sumterensis TaxID=1967501 RepID=UPI003F8400CA